MAENKSPDEDFTGSLEDWDDRVFNSAAYFRVHRFYDNGAHDTFQNESFAVVMYAAVDAMKAGARVIVYATTTTGRHQALVPERWVHYSKLWLDRKHGNEATIRRVAPVVRNK